MSARDPVTVLMTIAFVSIAAGARAEEGLEAPELLLTQIPGAGTMTIEAAELVLDLDAHSAVALHDVHLVLDTLEIEAQWLSVDLESARIEATDVGLVATMARGSVRAWADRLEATPTTSVLGSGTLTLCSCDPPPWSLGFTRLSMNALGDVTIVGGTLKLGPRLALPVPWLLLRTGRAPGLLPPELGWLASRGLHVSVGAYVPLPRDLDLEMRVGWIAPDGLTLASSVGGPGTRLQARLVLDPVGRGLESGWLHGSTALPGTPQPSGLVLDLPLASVIERPDMPGPVGGAARDAVSTLSVDLAPSATAVGFAVDVGLASHIVAQKNGSLGVKESWVRAPSVLLSLGPVGLGGRRFPVTLGAELQHLQLFRLGHVPAAEHLHATGAVVVLEGRWLPARVLDIGPVLFWHGLLVHGSKEGESTMWSQLAGFGLDGSLAASGPTSRTGISHRLELLFGYRGGYWARRGSPAGIPESWLAAPPPDHLASIGLVNGLLSKGSPLLTLDVRGWLVVRTTDRVGPYLSVGTKLDIGSLALDVNAVTALDSPASASVSTGLVLSSGRVTLRAGHLWFARGAITHLDLQRWSSAALSSGPVVPTGVALHLAMLALRVSISPTLILGLEGAMDLASGRMAYAQGSVSWSHPCGCLRMGIAAVGRAGIRAPDLLFTISV